MRVVNDEKLKLYWNLIFPHYFFPDLYSCWKTPEYFDKW